MHKRAWLGAFLRLWGAAPNRNRAFITCVRTPQRRRPPPRGRPAAHPLPCAPRARAAEARPRGGAELPRGAPARLPPAAAAPPACCSRPTSWLHC
ncbi:MAG: hypothetical protein J3K34DRAFT_420869 [Monoraphidium minutum]|nr:MAG: hypothetical protein J3K34DRAFT_420869 [Monoraphidium minutum]